MENEKLRPYATGMIIGILIGVAFCVAIVAVAMLLA